MKGKLIALYGINNIGKTTQAELLRDALVEAGFDAEYVKYPRYDVAPSGPYINSILREGKEASVEELQLWFTLNRHQVQKELQSKLSEGKIIIAEDYTGTGIAWGSVYNADEEWLKQINQHLQIEDLGILMTGARYLSGVEENHKNETNDKAVDKAISIHERLGKEYGWRRVEASGSIEEVHDGIMEVVLDFFQE